MCQFSCGMFWVPFLMHGCFATYRQNYVNKNIFGSKDVTYGNSTKTRTDEFNMTYFMKQWYIALVNYFVVTVRLLKNSINIERAFDFRLILKLHFNDLYLLFYK